MSGDRWAWLTQVYSVRMGRDKEPSGRKSWGSVDVSPPVHSTGEEQRSLTSDDSVSHMLLIPRPPPPQYELSSSLGYSSTRGTETHT